MSSDGIIVSCRCGQRFKAELWLAGRNIPCPVCKQTLVVGPVPQRPVQLREDNAIAVACVCGQRFAAVTHFLMERHFDQLMAYYRRLGDLPPDLVFNPEVLRLVFDEVFGSDRGALDAEWRAYMRSLKTNVDEILGE